MHFRIEVMHLVGAFWTKSVSWIDFEQYGDKKIPNTERVGDAIVKIDLLQDAHASLSTFMWLKNP